MFRSSIELNKSNSWVLISTFYVLIMSYRGKKVGSEILERDDVIRTVKKLNHIKAKMNISTTFSPDKKIVGEQRFKNRKKP